MSRTKLPGDSSNSDSIFLFLPGLHFYQLNFTSLSLHTCSLMSLCLFIRKTEYVLSSRTRFWYGLNVSMSEKSVLKPSNAVIYYVIYLPPASFSPVLTPVSSAQPLKLCTLSAKALADTAPVWVTLPSSDVLHHIPWQDHCIPKASLPNLCPAGAWSKGSTQCATGAAWLPLPNLPHSCLESVLQVPAQPFKAWQGPFR